MVLEGPPDSQGGPPGSKTNNITWQEESGSLARYFSHAQKALLSILILLLVFAMLCQCCWWYCSLLHSIRKRKKPTQNTVGLYWPAFSFMRQLLNEYNHTHSFLWGFKSTLKLFFLLCFLESLVFFFSFRISSSFLLFHKVGFNWTFIQFYCIMKATKCANCILWFYAKRSKHQWVVLHK